MDYEPSIALAVIVLPRGTKYVAAADVPRLASEALFPHPPAGFTESNARALNRATASEKIERDLAEKLRSGGLNPCLQDGTPIEGEPLKGDSAYIGPKHLRDFLSKYAVVPRSASDIDWHYWRTLGTLHGWEALALSLDIAPESLNDRRDSYLIGPGSWSPGFGASSTQQKVIKELRKRESLMDAALDDGRLEYADSYANGIFGRVKFSNFVEWFVPLQVLPLSPQLLGLYKPTATQKFSKRWQDDLPAEARGKFDGAEWHWPVRQEAIRRLAKRGYAKQIALANELVEYAKTSQRVTVTADSIKRHCLSGLVCRPKTNKSGA
jgi:hypothetical protein